MMRQSLKVWFCFWKEVCAQSRVLIKFKQFTKLVLLLFTLAHLPHHLVGDLFAIQLLILLSLVSSFLWLDALLWHILIL